MSISVSRKLQALKALEFGGLDIEVHRVALTPDQVREYGLPSTPLKDTERRADKWTAAMGVEQRCQVVGVRNGDIEINRRSGWKTSGHTSRTVW